MAALCYTSIVLATVGSPARAVAQQRSPDEYINRWLQTANNSDRALLLAFSGDASAEPGDRFRRELLGSPEFRRAMDDSWFLVDCASDHSSESSIELTAADVVALQRHFQLRAVPTLLIVGRQGKPFAQLAGYSGERPEDVVSELAEQRAKLMDFQRHLSSAKTAHGVESALRLHTVLREIPSDWLVDHYRDEIELILLRDADNSGGFYVSYRLKLIRHDADSESLQASIEAVDDILRRFELPPEQQQEARFAKAAFLYDVDRAESQRCFEKAQKDLPHSELAKKIETILERAFADSNATPNR